MCQLVRLKKSNFFFLEREYTNYHTMHVSFLCTNIGMKASDSYLQLKATEQIGVITSTCHKISCLILEAINIYMKRVSEV